MTRVPRPFDMQQLVNCLGKRFGPVALRPEDGYTKIVVQGVALTFPQAERVCLGEAPLEEFRQTE